MKNKNNLDTRVSKKAIIIGLILVVINVYWIAIMSELWYSLFTLVNPFSNAIFSLIILIAINFILIKLTRYVLFSQVDLMAIYIMISIASTISGATMMTSLMGTLAHPFWFASPENEWQQLFWKYIPGWITVSDLNIVEGYFTGETTFHNIRYIKAWIIPILAWSGLIFMMYLSMLCISSIIRKQWTENEKLTYPITQLPTTMVTDRNFFRSKAMWIGFGIVAFIRIVNGFHDLLPSIPQFPYGFRLDPYLTEKPWNSIGYVWMSFNFAIVGLTYFMPLDLSFSCWFFFWLTRGERVLASLMGWQSLYLNERASGAWIGICLLTLWAGRRHLTKFLKHVIGRESIDESNEIMGYRTAVLLFLFSFAGIVVFCYLAGMSLWAILMFYFFYYVLAIALGRVRAELGPPYHELIDINPRKMMVNFFGPMRLRGNNLTVMTFLYGFNRCSRAHPMPVLVESVRMSEKVNMRGSKLIQAITLAVAVGAIATLWSYLQLAYKYGVSSKLRGWIAHSGWESFNPLQNWLQYPQGTNVPAMYAMGGGFTFVVFLYIMRTRFLWWPLHASGYVLSGASWGGMIYFWFPVMVSWLIKSIILKHGGRGTHRKAIPFFLGLIIGDYIPRSIFSIVSLILNMYMPSSGSGHTL
ncbi:hypothetical protein GF312_16495 [Candidatus Poribacteria bacterium]|nr:hypothetical protein [Candidatus Poribacteria bacterium]